MQARSENALRLERWRRKRGIKPRVRPLSERLLDKRIITASGCWEWAVAKTKNGYATTTLGSRGKKEYLHRISYREFIGSIPDGKEIDHLCRNRSCFSPAHLEAVTRSVNTLRGDGPKLLGSINASKTHCKHGHLFDDRNTRLRPSGGRDCRACARVKQKLYRDRSK